MKKRIILTGLVLATTLLSCKKDNEQAAQPDAAAVEQPVENQMVVTLKATVQNDDSFQLYYTNEKDEPFEQENSQWIELKGNAAPQEIKFTLPEGVIPNYLRLDLGVKDNQKEIQIESFDIAFMGKTIKMGPAEFFNYFIPNESVEVIDRSTGKIKPKKMPSGTYDPLVYSEEGLRLQLQGIQ